MLYYGPSYEYDIYACVNYWFVVLVNNVSIPCKCICYKITEIVPVHFLQCRGAILCNILYKIRKYIIYTTGISYRDDTLSM